MHRLDGEYEESLKAWEKLTRLDPAARAVAAYNRARIFIYLREFEKAHAELDKGFKVEPNHPMLKIFRSGVYYYEGRHDEAIELMSSVLKEHPRMDGIKPLFAMFLAGAGRVEEAKEQLTADALAIARSDHDTAYWVGSSYALLGDKDQAFKWLGKAVRLGNQNLVHFEHDKNLNTIRDDPRWPELIAKVKDGE
jgi:tetratricopeptide (TPR) repeat protein